MPLWPKITLTLLALVLSACSHLGQADELSAPLTAVNYTDWPFDWVGVTKVETPNQTMAADRVSAFSASGLMCCVILPREWRKGMELIVATRDGTRAETPEEWSKEKLPTIQHRVPVPPYTPQDMGTVWVQLLPGGKVVLVVSRYDPDHPSWPGEVKGWPVPTLEFRRQIWDRDMSLLQKSLARFEIAIKKSSNQGAVEYQEAIDSVKRRMQLLGSRP
jgi:hypothetical protein